MPTRPEELDNIEQRQGTTGRDPYRPGRDLARILEQYLCCPDGQYARQCPAEERNGPLLRAGSENDSFGFDDPRVPFPAHEGAEAGLDLPDLGTRLVDCATGAKRLDYLATLDIGRAQHIVTSGGVFDRAPDLSARPRLIVNNHHFELMATRRDRSRHASRTGADDEKV
jgi:hypothetical protein